MGLVLKTSGKTSKQYIEACAPCHSRRTSFGPNEHTDPEYYNLHRPQNISPPLYYADGQILDEVYVFASLTQSKMYMHDVKCSDCHDSHSIKFKFDGNALCTQCHRPEEYDTFQHTFINTQTKRVNPLKINLVKWFLSVKVPYAKPVICQAIIIWVLISEEITVSEFQDRIFQ